MATKDSSKRTKEKSIKRRIVKADDAQASPPGGYAPAAAFDGTIATNRGLAVTSASSVPKPPPGYVATDPNIRRRQLRRIAASLRAEMATALTEVNARGKDLQSDFGKFAPDGAQAGPILSRLTKTGALLAAATSLYQFAQEVDQIAVSDAVVLLDAVNKLLGGGASKNPQLAAAYKGVIDLFQQRGQAISTGRARAKTAKKTGTTPTGSTNPNG